ncbi:MAG: hypothetical protein GYA31_01875 [Parcubacteria group bacterium]|nr:hypothetical protein [Parcubacteria group bacterium]
MRQDKFQDGLFYWTKHSQEKLRQYGLSASRIKRLIRHPERIEAGIAPETWASMQSAGSKKHPYEIWTMYVIENPEPHRIQGHAPYVAQESKMTVQLSSSRKRGTRIPVSTGMTKQNSKKIKIISAWKYPGKTNPGDPIPIPPDIFEEIMISFAKTSPKAKFER